VTRYKGRQNAKAIERDFPYIVEMAVPPHGFGSRLVLVCSRDRGATSMVEDVETIRAKYRPARITTLFVGESAPHGGAFFYRGDSGMSRYMRGVVEQVLGTSDDFLKTFKAYGWYLDDLVLTPVNHLSNSQRRTLCHAAQQSLAERIADYQPESIVSLLKSIEPFVRGAAIAAGSNATLYAVPFPGMGQQVKFRDAMTQLVPKLPRAAPI
jgi:hypothetical protein